MIRSTDYNYINEDSINVLLKCKLCSKPFVNPVKTTDGRRGCRECISSDDENSQNLIPIEEKLLLEMLEDLRIECIKCKETNIRRGDLEQHNNTTCIKRICSCKAVDLKCPWTGFYEQLNHHLESCSFELLRPILTEILNQNKQSNEQINQNRISLNEQQHEIEKLKQQPLVSKSEHNIKYDDVQELREQCNRLQNEIQQLKTQNKQYKNQILLLQQEFDDFKNHVHQQITHNNELEKLNQLRPEFKQSDNQNEIQQIKQLQTEINQLSEHILKHDTEVLQLQTKDQNQRDEIIYIKQLCNQHDIQIKLLARKKCVIPTVTSYNNPKLEQLIEACPNDSEIDLNGKLLIDRDMDIIFKKAIIEKKCKKLRLEKNDITGKGATTLASVLFNNTTLMELCLSKNRISDMGVHALVQTLSINNSTLKSLDLQSNNITDEGAEYLSEMLKTNKTIILLGLGFNEISDHGVQLLANSLTYHNESLQELFLSSNKSISDMSVPSLIEMLRYNPSLKALWLKDCSLTRTAATKLKQAIASHKNFILEI